jgi:hypothetical protein
MPNASIQRKTLKEEGCITDPEPDMDTGRASVRNMRSKCRCSYVLQFTFRHAVCCVLHRPPSQVIHCAVLSFFKDNLQVCHERLFRNSQVKKENVLKFFLSQGRATKVFKPGSGMFLKSLRARRKNALSLGTQHLEKPGPPGDHCTCRNLDSPRTSP